MKTYISFSILGGFGFKIGQYGFHGYAFRCGLHVCREPRLAGERRAWIERGADMLTGRIGPFTFTASRHGKAGSFSEAAGR